MNSNDSNISNMSDNKLVDPPEDSDESSTIADSDDSPSSCGDLSDQIFENEPLVLELRALRDELPDNPLPEVKTRKLLKKRAKSRPEELTSMASSSEESVHPPGPGEFSTEEFFDAHESYYDLPAARSNTGSQKSPSTGVISNLTASESHQTNSSKVQQGTETTTRSDATTATPSAHSFDPPALPQTAISKPTHLTEPE